MIREAPKYNRPPDYAKYRDRAKLPPFAWEGNQQANIRIKHIFFHSTENDFAIVLADLLPEQGHTNQYRARMEWTIKVKGQFPGAAIGRIYDGIGKWDFDGRDPKYAEWGMIAEGMTIGEPASRDEIEEFLTTVDQIGPKRAKRLITVYGTDALTVLDTALKEGSSGWRRVVTKAGIGGEHLTTTMNSYVERREDFSATQLLGAAGIFGSLRRRTWARYGRGLRDAMRLDPLSILDIDGMSFRQADTLWRKCGMEDDDVRRIGAGLGHVLNTIAQWGDCWAPMGDVLRDAASQSVLGLPNLPELWIERELEQHDDVKRSVVVDGEGNMWRRDLWNAEITIAERISALIAHPGKLDAKALARVPYLVDQILKERNFPASPEQRDALMGIPFHRVAMLTGPAGSGKTTIERLIIELFSRLGLRTQKIAAPTGAAARRSTRACGGRVRASTVHKLLGLQPDGAPEFNEDNPLPADVIIVDETSMLGTKLMASLMAAVAAGTHVLFVGDPNQLPAVGPGATLRDLINSTVVKHFALPRSSVFRQKAGSGLLEVAYAVLDGRPLELTKADGTPKYADVRPIEITGRNQAKNLVDVVLRRWNEVRNPEALKVLVYGKGKKTDDGDGNKLFQDAGVHHLNLEIQKTIDRINGGTTVKSMGFEFWEGVYGLWTANTNELGFDMVNGQEFVFKRIYEDEESGEIFAVIKTVDAMGVPIEHTFSTKQYEGDFMLGYAWTVHKAQGNEYPEVLFVIRGADGRISKEAVYTAVTRAKERLIIAGEVNKLWNLPSELERRRTSLAPRIYHAANTVDSVSYQLAPVVPYYDIEDDEELEDAMVASSPSFL